MPTVVLEAMASGVPVVATAISGIPDLIEDGSNGILVPPRELEKLASALQKVVSEPDIRHRLGKAARKTIQERYSLDIVTENHISASRQALNETHTFRESRQKIFLR